MKRRDFIITTGCGTASMLMEPIFPEIINTEEWLPNLSAMNIRLNVKFVIQSVIHEGAWEGPCRTGSLQNLTYEKEKERLDKRFEDFKKEIGKMQFFRELEILEPVKTNVWIEKGNPELMFPVENIEILAKDDSKTDVYVLYSDAKPGLAAINIATHFRKPVIMASQYGWGVAIPAALRNSGYEGYYVQNDDELRDLLNLLFVRKALSKMKLLIVTNFPGSMDRIGVAKSMDMDFMREKYGIGYQYVGYDEFFKLMKKQESDKNSFEKAHEISKRLLDGASGSNMSLEDIMNSVRFYLAAHFFMEEYSCNAFTVDCPELCSSLIPWDKRFTPCLCHAMFKDMGYPSSCECDIPALVSMAIQMFLSRKAVYMGNAQLNIRDNTLDVHHSVASLKMLGFDQSGTGYKIEAFTKSGFGVTLRHDFKENQNKIITVGRFSPSGKKMLITKGTIIDGNTLGCGCAQSVKLQITDSKEFLEKQQNFGNHLTLVYGDYTRQTIDLGKIMGFEVESVL
jgi:L-fucose isomerase-like protein